MVETKNLVKKSTKDIPFYASDWMNIDKSIENLRRDMEKAFSSFPSISIPKMSHASLDIIDEGTQFRVKMDVPGIKKNEIKINVADNYLEVSVEHKKESKEEKKNYLRKERSHVSYYRSLPLSEKITTDKVIAKLTDGVLDVILPKSKPTEIQKKKSIIVQ